MNEMLSNILYMMHASFVWGGGLWQIYQTYTSKSAGDIAIPFIVGLLLSEFMALPRALSSRYWVWGLCHIVSAVLVAILLVGVLLYR